MSSQSIINNISPSTPTTFGYTVPAGVTSGVITGFTCSNFSGADSQAFLELNGVPLVFTGIIPTGSSVGEGGRIGLSAGDVVEVTCYNADLGVNVTANLTGA